MKISIKEIKKAFEQLMKKEKTREELSGYGLISSNLKNAETRTYFYA